MGLILATTLSDYYCGLKIDETTGRIRKRYLIFSISLNLCILGFFKYFGFFYDSARKLADMTGVHLDNLTLSIVLPVGISFYIFKSMSYVIDVYRGKLGAETKLSNYALFVAFFPQLLAGPIERAGNLLPQIDRKRIVTPEHLREGLWLLYWGFFKKVFMADNLARIVDAVFLKTGVFSGGEALMGIYAFTFQIYGDFSGYSDMARGLGKLMGFDLMENFRFPYFVTNPRDFWRNWHISLSTWLRDYLYIPLGGNKGTSFVLFRNLLITMLLGGLWHGAAWTFVLWGAYHGFLLMSHRLIEPFLKKIEVAGGINNYLWYGLRMIFMFHLTALGWLIFRSKSPGQVTDMLHNVITNFAFNGMAKYYGLQIVFYTGVMLFIQVFKYRTKDMFVVFGWPKYARVAVQLLLFYLIAGWGEFGAKQFIYLQF